MGRVECTDAGVTLAEQGPQVEDQLLRHRPRLKKPPSGGSNFGAASASPPSRFERLTSLKPPALPGDIYFSLQRVARVSAAADVGISASDLATRFLAQHGA